MEEWSNLGERYPPAQEALEELAITSIELLERTRNAERFHDYIAVCEYLKRDNLPIDKFLHYHNVDRELANDMVRFIWPQLVDSENWSVCSEYMPNSMRSYENALLKCDQAMDVYLSDPKLYGDRFARQIRGWYMSDVSNILLVLKNSARVDEINPIVERMRKDMAARKCDEVAEKVVERVAL